MESRSASSTTMSEVGSGIALFFASYSSKVWKYVGGEGWQLSGNIRRIFSVFLPPVSSRRRIASSFRRASVRIAHVAMLERISRARCSSTSTREGELITLVV
jgi:hypothetical protein